MSYMKIICKLGMILYLFVILLISGNFPEIAWRAMHSRQAAHPFLRLLLCF